MAPQRELLVYGFSSLASTDRVRVSAMLSSRITRPNGGSKPHGVPQVPPGGKKLPSSRRLPTRAVIPSWLRM